MSQSAYIIDAVRTPRSAGKPGKGSLCNIHPQHLLGTTLSALRDRNRLNTAEVDDVIAGCGSQIARQGMDIARMATLDAGWDTDAPGVTIDRFCGSGLSAVSLAAMGIMSGQQDLVVGGGVEKMSDSPLMPMPLLTDSNNAHLRELHPTAHQGVCADLIATLNDVTREQADALAVESQRRAALAIENGFFKSVVPVYDYEGNLVIDQDNYNRPGTSMESLSALSPAFAEFYDRPLDDDQVTCRELVEKSWPDIQLNHIHHAGNSSGIVDGAASVLLASKNYAKQNGLTKRARIVSMAIGTCDPRIMLDAPADAARRCLANAGMTTSDIDLWEINEAFAVVPLKFMREMNLDPEIVNVNGGAMALGHPIGATGAMLVGTVLDELERRDLSTGLITLCAAGGMAPAMIIERV